MEGRWVLEGEAVQWEWVLDHPASARTKGEGGEDSSSTRRGRCADLLSTAPGGAGFGAGPLGISVPDLAGERSLP